MHDWSDLLKRKAAEVLGKPEAPAAEQTPAPGVLPPGRHDRGWPVVWPLGDLLTDAERRRLDPHARLLWSMHRDSEAQAGWHVSAITWGCLGESSRDIWRYLASQLLRAGWKGGGHESV